VSLRNIDTDLDRLGVASLPVERRVLTDQEWADIHAACEMRDFTEEDLTEAYRLGEAKLANADRLGTPHLNRFRDDRINGYVDGFLGEWAVADSLGLDRAPNIEGVADPGYDYRSASGLTIQVRCTPYLDGRLMCPTNRFFKSQWAVMAIRIDTPAAVMIVGGVEVETFRQQSRKRDFGWGMTRYMEQWELIPWATLRKTFL
jgi:hypothetical protein